MPNVQYTVTLNDSNFSSKLSSMESQAERLEKKLSNLGNNIGGGSGGGFFGSGAKGAAIGLGVAFGMAAFDIIKKGMSVAYDFGKDLIERGSRQTLQRQDINILAGDEIGPKLFQEAKQYALKSMLGSEVFGNVSQMLSYGFNTDKVMPLLKAAADITGGNKDKFNRLIYAASEFEAGDVQKRHLRQLTMAGIPIEDLAAQLKMSVPQLLHAIKKQQITGPEITKAIIDLANDPKSPFYKRQEGLMNTPAGRIQQLQEGWDFFKADLGERILMSPGFTKFLNSVNDLFNNSSEFGNKLYDFFDRIFENMGVIVGKIEKWVNDGGLDKLFIIINKTLDLLEVSWPIFMGALEAIIDKLTVIAKGFEGLRNLKIFGQPLFEDWRDGYTNLPKWATNGETYQKMNEFGQVGTIGVSIGDREKLKKEIDVFGGYKDWMSSSTNQKYWMEHKKFPGYDEQVRQNLLKDVGLGPTPKTDGLNSDILKKFGMDTKDTKIDSKDDKKSPFNLDVLGGGDSSFGSKESKVSGPRSTTINIDIDSMIKQLVFNTTNLKESSDNVEAAMTNALSNAIIAAEGAIGQR